VNREAKQDPNPPASATSVIEGDTPAEQGQFTKLILEAGPLVVFFIINSYFGIFPATGAFMVATILALTVSRVKFGRIPIMPLVSGFFVLTFGALTLYFQEEYFIKIKPTIVNLLFATILFGGLLAGHSLLRYLFGDVFKLKNRGWQILTFRWACFFVFLAIVNEIVWRNFSTDFWAGFKLMGIMPITMIFAISQVGLLQRYDASEPTEAKKAE
jgi:intracellular septation protein